MPYSVYGVKYIQLQYMFKYMLNTLTWYPLHALQVGAVRQETNPKELARAVRALSYRAP